MREKEEENQMKGVKTIAYVSDEISKRSGDAVCTPPLGDPHYSIFELCNPGYHHRTIVLSSRRTVVLELNGSSLFLHNCQDVELVQCWRARIAQCDFGIWGKRFHRQMLVMYFGAGRRDDKKLSCGDCDQIWHGEISSCGCCRGVSALQMGEKL